MKQVLPLLPILTLFACLSAIADSGEYRLARAAFYEGETLNYIIYPPDGFEMVDSAAIHDGYSFAFVPENSDFLTADRMIGVNIFKIRGMTFDAAVTGDTNSVREHYGEQLSIWPVDSVFDATGRIIPTFFVNDTTRHIPNVMISYFDGGTEIVIFELVISEHVLRYRAEEDFIECLQRFKALPVGDLGYE